MIAKLVIAGHQVADTRRLELINRVRLSIYACAMV